MVIKRRYIDIYIYIYIYIYISLPPNDQIWIGYIHKATRNHHPRVGGHQVVAQGAGSVKSIAADVPCPQYCKTRKIRKKKLNLVAMRDRKLQFQSKEKALSNRNIVCCRNLPTNFALMMSTLCSDNDRLQLLDTQILQGDFFFFLNKSFIARHK